MIDPKCMCRKHLLGEHVECHMFLGTFKKKKNIAGYLKNNLLEIKLLKERHDELECEMRNRGYRTNSKIEAIEFKESIEYIKEFCNQCIDSDKSRDDLLSRCSECRNLYEVNDEKKEYNSCPTYG